MPMTVQDLKEYEKELAEELEIIRSLISKWQKRNGVGFTLKPAVKPFSSVREDGKPSETDLIKKEIDDSKGEFEQKAVAEKMIKKGLVSESRRRQLENNVGTTLRAAFKRKKLNRRNIGDEMNPKYLYSRIEGISLSKK